MRVTSKSTRGFSRIQKCEKGSQVIRVCEKFEVGSREARFMTTALRIMARILKSLNVEREERLFRLAN